MGNAVLEQLVAPVVHGVHSVHPDDLSLDRAHPGLRAALALKGSLAAAVQMLRDAAPAGSAVAGIRGGVHRLVTELEADLTLYGVDVQLGRRVRATAALDGTVIMAAPPEGGAGRQVVLATLVVEAPELDASPRGTGVLVAQGARGIRARALTHATAKWEWLRERAGGRHVLRLSYETEPENLAEAARNDASALLGVTLPEPLDFARVEWVRPAAVTPAAGAVTVGETVAGSGLAGIIAHAERTAEALLAD
jgi:oxygen-dependent protoporphyrinogen oxidase